MVVGEDDRVRPEDCDDEDTLSETFTVLEALSRIFDGRKVFVWNNSRKLWSRVDEASQELVQGNAALKVIKPPPGE
jgi:predicted solute-binding protein